MKFFLSRFNSRFNIDCLLIVIVLLISIFIPLNGHTDPVKELPPPPQIIAPTNLIRPDEMNLEPEKAHKLELKYKADADRAYGQHDYKETLVALQRAYLISKNPRYIANQGLVLKKLGRYEEAIQALEYFLLTSPPPDKEEAALKVLIALQPEVKIISDPPNAEVILDGKLLKGQRTPISLRMIARKHSLELRLKGYETLKSTFFIEENKPTTLQYLLTDGS